MKKILIAGSTGFVGRNLKSKLFENKDYEIKTLDRKKGDYNFTELDSIEDVFDTIFVLFALLPSKDLSLNDYLEINYELVKKLVDKFPKARFVYTSSISIYENSTETPCNELSQGVNISNYAQSKLKSESLFFDNDSIILRLSSIYGPGMKESSFLPIVLNSALDKNKITLIGDSSRKQNYSYIDDVVDFLIEAGLSKEHGVFNAVNNESHSNEELASLVQKLLPSTELERLADERLFYSFEISNEKWLNCFNYGSKISLEEGLRKYLKYKKDA